MTEYKCTCGWEPPEFIVELDQTELTTPDAANKATSNLQHVYISIVCPTCNVGRIQPLVDKRLRIRMLRITGPHGILAKRK